MGGVLPLKTSGFLNVFSHPTDQADFIKFDGLNDIVCLRASHAMPFCSIEALI